MINPVRAGGRRPLQEQLPLLRRENVPPLASGRPRQTVDDAPVEEAPHQVLLLH